MKKFCISSAAEDVLIPYEQMFQTHNFESHVEIQPDVFFKGNEQLLKQMLSIMLDNVLKYAKPNGKVDFSLKKSGKNVEIVLTNDVESISIGNRDELFERFYRADASRNSLKEGNGIGLSAVKAIVETHKGSVTAESTDGATLTFKVLL